MIWNKWKTYKNQQCKKFERQVRLYTHVSSFKYLEEVQNSQFKRNLQAENRNDDMCNFVHRIWEFLNANPLPVYGIGYTYTKQDFSERPRRKISFFWILKAQCAHKSTHTHSQSFPNFLSDVSFNDTIYTRRNSSNTV